MKKCNTCHQEFPLTDFWKGSAKCQCCQKKRAKELAKSKRLQCPQYAKKGKFTP